MIMHAPYLRDLLTACQESVGHQIALIAQLAAAWQLAPADVYYHWCMHRPQAATLYGTPWRYFFHGTECDMTHQGDGRFVRIEFGPGGRADCLSPWSVLQFIMTSKPPWGYYPALQAQVAKEPPPFNELSGDYTRMAALLEPLYTAHLIVRADPLLYELQQQWRTVDRDGRQCFSLQPPYDNPTKRPFWDMAVCQRMILDPHSNVGRDGVKRRREGDET
jgi:hypothetical protein